MFSGRRCYLRARVAVVMVSLLITVLFPSGLSFLGGGLSGTVAANQARELFFTILHTNDEHSSVIPHYSGTDFSPEIPRPAVGGFARLATAIKMIREEKQAAGEPVLLLSAGDYVGGSPYSWLIPGGLAPELTLMQFIGYDAVTIGNHEFDYGPANLARYYQSAGYPAAHERTAVIASNILAPADHPLSRDLYRTHHLLKLDNGLKVGLFGLIGEDAIRKTSDPSPITFKDQFDAAREAVSELEAQGADVIVAITHAGVEEDRELAQGVPGIHVIIGGHSHDALYEPLWENGVIIAQAGSLLKYVGQLELAYDPDAGSLRLRNEESNNPYLVLLDDRYPLDLAVDSLIEEYTEALSALILLQTGGRFSHVFDTVAVSPFPLPNTPPLQETPLGNFVADAMRIITSQKTGTKVDIAIQANGSIRGSIIPRTLDHSPGEIALYDLAKVVGLGVSPDGSAGSPIVSAYLTGEEVRRLLEVAVLLQEMLDDDYFLQFSGMRYYYNPRNAILFTLPVLNQPIPSAVLPGSLGAVTRAELYTGDGLQGAGEEGFVPIRRGDQELYHLVTDAYILSFLPMVGEMLPMLNLEIKDAEGNVVPMDRLDDLIVSIDGTELKVWQAVVEHAAAQPLNAAGVPEIDAYYKETSGRVNPVKTFPLAILPILVLVLIVVLLRLLLQSVRRHRFRRKARVD